MNQENTIIINFIWKKNSAQVNNTSSALKQIWGEERGEVGVSGVG